MKSNRVLGEKKHDDDYYYLKKGFFGKEFFTKGMGRRKEGRVCPSGYMESKKKPPPFAELGGMNEAKLIGFGNRMMMMMMNDK